MYKVKQHLNGTVYVFDRSTGRLTMIIKGDNKENGVTQSESLASKTESKMGQLLYVNNFSYQALKDKYLPAVSLPKITLCSDDGKDNRKSAAAAAAEISNGVASRLECAPRQRDKLEDEEEEETEVLEEPVDKTSFLKLFALKPVDSPLLSRPPLPNRSSKPLVVNRDSPRPLVDVEEHCSVSRRVISDVDLTSRLGQIVLKQARNGNVWVRDCAQNVSRYEKYCLVSSRRFGSWEIVPRDCNGSCIYHVTYQPIPTNNHKYIFSRKQRLERQRIIDTGLNKRARRLKRLCRNVSVKLVRLTKAEIVKWTARRTFTTTQSHLSRLLKKPPGLPQIGACIDGTIVIEINDSSDEDDVKVSPKPKQTTLCPDAVLRPSNAHLASRNISTFPQTQSPRVTISTGGRLLSFSNLFPKTRPVQVTEDVPVGPSRCLKTYSKIGCNPRQDAACNPTGLSCSIVDRNRSCRVQGKRTAVNVSRPCKNGSGPKSARIVHVANGHDNSDDSDSSDSDIVFLGCVPSKQRSKSGSMIDPGAVPPTGTGQPRFVVTDFCQTDLGGASPLKQRDQIRPMLSSPVKVVPQILVYPLVQAHWPESGPNSARLSKVATSTTNGQPIAGKTYAAHPKRPLGSPMVVKGVSGQFLDNGSGVSDASMEKMVTHLVSQAVSHEIATLNTKAFHQENGVRLVYTFTCHLCSSEEVLTANAMKAISWHMGHFHGGLGGATLVSNVDSVGSREIAISVQAFGSGP